MVPSLEHSTAEETSLVPILLFGFLFLAVWKMMGSWARAWPGIEDQRDSDFTRL